MRTLSAAESVKVASGGYAPVLRVSLEDAGGVFRDVDSYFGDQRFLVGVSLQEGVDDQGPTASVTLRREIFEHSLSPLMLSSGTARGYVPSASPSPAVALYRRVKVEWYIAAVDELTSSPTYTEWFVGRIDTISLSGENIELSCRDANVAVLSDSFFERERLYGLTPGGYAVQKGCVIWAPGETQAVGDLAVPSTLNGYLYRATAITTGVTGATEPTWPTTVGNTVVDGGVTWTCGVATATGGVSLENVLQQMLNDSPVSLTLYAPDASSFLLNPWKQEREPILEAMRKLTQLIGWDLRPRYDSAGAYQFQLYKPDRAAASPVRTFSPSSYLDVSSLALNIENIRNVVRVVYSDSTDLGADGAPRRKTSTATDTASVTSYGRRYMEIAEEATSQVDTAAEAAALVSAALSDLATPTAELEVETFCFPWAQVGDLYRFSANDVHFDSDQDLAVVNVSHDAQLGTDGEQTFRTSLQCRGKPSGGRDRWLQWDSRPGVAPSHSLQDSLGGGTLSVAGALDVVGGARLKLTEKLQRTAKFDGYEIHLSTVPGFTPSASTLSAVSKADTVEIGNLEPGTTYYARAIPRQLNAGRIVQGRPTAEVSFVAGYAAPRALQPAVDYGMAPVNGEFEAWTSGASSPPDGWTMNNGTWGTNVTRVTRVAGGLTSGGYALNFGTAAGAGRVSSSVVRVTGNTMYKLSARRRASASATADQYARIEWLDGAQALISTSDLSLGYTNLNWITASAEYQSPINALYARIIVGRFGTAGASTFEVDSVLFERSAYISGVVSSQIADGAVTSAKLDTNIAVAGTFSALGNTGIGTASPGARLHVVASATTAPSLTWGASAGQILRNENSELAVGLSNASPFPLYLQGRTNASAARDIALQPLGGKIGVAVYSPEELVEIRTGTAAWGLLHSTGTIKVGTYLGVGDAQFGTKSNHDVGFVTNNGAVRLRVQAAGHSVPGADNTYTLGASGARWSQVWAANATIQTSDERQKDSIKDSDLGLSFIEALRPVQYRWKVGQHVIERHPDGEDENGQPKFREELVPQAGKRPHYGFLAQEVERAMGGRDFAGLVFDPAEDVYGLRYEEFIGPLVKAVQELSERVRHLERQLAERQ